MSEILHILLKLEVICVNDSFKNIGITVCVLFFVAYLIFPERGAERFAANAFSPGMTYIINGEERVSWKRTTLETVFPLYQYVNNHAPILANTEDKTTYEMILSQQANDENAVSEDLNQDSTVSTSSKDLSIEKLRDFNYLLNTFYTVDSTTTISSEQLNADELLSRSMKIDTTTKGPKVLIFHTHSQEAFVDSKAGDASTTIVGVGACLAEKLNAKGIETLHHTGVYDLINGKLDRSKAYEQAEAGVREILKKYPSIEVVIDLHRDGVPETTHLVTEINGKQTAKIMFFNGLSRTKSQGDIAYLKNPYIQDNLSFSLQMQLQAEQMYSGLTRKIYLKGYRYSLHMMPKSLLIEAGAQTNTVQETKNAMDLLANMLCKVLL